MRWFRTSNVTRCSQWVYKSRYSQWGHLCWNNPRMIVWVTYTSLEGFYYFVCKVNNCWSANQYTHTKSTIETLEEDVKYVQSKLWRHQHIIGVVNIVLVSISLNIFLTFSIVSVIDFEQVNKYMLDGDSNQSKKELRDSFCSRLTH